MNMNIYEYDMNMILTMNMNILSIYLSDMNMIMTMNMILNMMIYA